MRLGSTGTNVLGEMEHIIAEARRPRADDGSPETVDMLLMRMYNRSQDTNMQSYAFSTDESETRMLNTRGGGVSFVVDLIFKI